MQTDEAVDNKKLSAHKIRLMIGELYEIKKDVDENAQENISNATHALAATIVTLED